MRLLPDKQLAVRKTAGGWRLFDLNPLYDAEDRIHEIQSVTPHKAPELLAFFNKAWLKADEAVKLLEMELLDAKQSVAKKRAEIILDKCEDIFAAKGLRASADLRQAVVDADPEYAAALDSQNSLEAAVAFLKGKQKGVEMAYLSVRKILGESTYNMRNSSNSAGSVEDRNTFEESSPRSSFGRHKE